MSKPHPHHDRVSLPTHGVLVRWVTPRDLVNLVELHNQLGGTWTIDQFRTMLRARTVVGLIAECYSDGATIRGYAIYEYLSPTTLRVLEFGAADPVARATLLESVSRRAINSGRPTIEFAEPSY